MAMLGDFTHVFRLKAGSLICVFLGFFYSSAGLASVDKNNIRELLNLSLNELLQVEVTSSTLTPMRLKSVPASITVFTQQQIRNMGVHFLYELTNFAPGFQTFRQGENSIQHYHSARGHRSSASSREILVLLDGVRVNREFDNASAIPMISLFNVEKVEFIRGPGSALYGSNAFLGVIDIKTTKRVNQLRLIGGEAERKQLSAMGTTSVNGWSLSTAINAFDENGVDYQLQNYNTNVEESAKDPRQGRDAQLNISGGNTQIDAMYFNRIAEDFYITDRTSNDVNRTEYRSSSFRLQHSIDFDTDFRSTISAGYSDNFIARRLDNPALLGTENSTQDEDNYDFRIHNQWSYNSRDNFVFGLSYRDSDFEAFKLESPALRADIYPKSKRQIAGMYLQNQSQLTDQLQLTVGGRYDYYKDIDGELSPRIGLVSAISNQQMIKLLYGKAFRAPTVNELTLNPPGGQVLGNANLKPETIETWELIWLGQWDSQNFSATTYYNTIDTAIVREQTLSGSTFNNVRKQESFYGVELEFSVEVLQNLMLNGNVSAMESLPDSDFRQADRLASLALNYHRPRWNLNINSNYASEREMQVGAQRIALDDYWLVNIHWLYSINRFASLFIGGKNILNEEYETPSQLARHTEAMPNRGHEFYLGVNLTLD